MKYLIAIIALVSGLASAQVNIRPITQINDVNRIGLEYYDKQIVWFQGDSLRFDIYARDGRVPLNLTGQTFPVLFVTAETNRQIVYIAKTGTVVSATNGHVRAELPATGATLATNQNYTTWMIVFRAVNGVTSEIATVAYAHTRVLPSPLGVTYTNVGQVTNFNIDVSGILTEYDPVFTSSVAAGITSVATGNWTTAYLWGNHATNNYPARWSSQPATQNVNFAQLYATNTGGIDFDATPSGAVDPGRLQWEATRSTLRLGLNANVALDVGQQLPLYAKSVETNTISKGEVVYVSGASGDNPTVRRASNASEAQSARTIGIAAENITSNNNGFVITRGTIYNINTASFSAGDPLYLGPNGTLQTNLPDAPLHGVFIGTVERVGSNNGQIFVAVQNYQELRELSDVKVNGLANRNLIAYNSASNRWENYTIAALGIATGSPIYAESPEADPVWSAASNNVSIQLSSLTTGKVDVATYGPATAALWSAVGSIVSAANALTNVTGSGRIAASVSGNVAALTFDATGLATGVPVYVESPETDPLWSASSGTVFEAIADKEERYALRTLQSTNWILLATNISIDANFTNVSYSVTGGIFAIKAESDISGLAVSYEVCDQVYQVPAYTSVVEFVSACTNIIIDAEFLPLVESPSNTIFALYYAPFAYTNAINATNDLRATTVLVDDPVLASEPVTKRVHDEAIAAIRVDQWSGSPAVTAVDFAGNQILFGNNFEAVATTNAFTISYNGSSFMRFVAGSGSSAASGTAYITSARITPTNVVLGVYSSPGFVPSPQYGIDGTNWFNILSFTTTYPTQTYGVTTLTFDTPATNSMLWFRPVITNDPSYGAESTLEVTSDNLKLLGRRIIINDTNGNGVVTLSATGGLKVGTASFTADAAGNIAQDATNTAALGQASIDRITNNMKIGAQLTGAPGYSRAILFEAGGVNANPPFDNIPVSTNRLSSYNNDLYFYDPSNTNRLLGWQTRIVTEGSLAAGISQGGIKIGTNSFQLDANGSLAANWNLGGYTISNGVVAGYVSTGLLASTLSSYATGTPIYSVSGLATGTPIYSLAGLATGTPLYAYTETDTIATNRLTNYYTIAESGGLFATGTPLYAYTETDTVATNRLTNYYTIAQADGRFATGSPIYSVSGLATGTPLYGYTETDTIATNALTNYYTIAQAGALFATGAPLYTADGFATGTPVYAESDPIWAAASNIYVTTNALTNTLSSYATTASLSGYVATNGSAAGLVSFPASLVSVSSGNSNYWRITTAPASNASFGQRGQMAVSSSNVFIYNPDGGGAGTGRWIRISGSVSW